MKDQLGSLDKQMDSFLDQMGRQLGTGITTAQLLTEIEDLIRTMPVLTSLNHSSEEVMSWRGRLAAVIQIWQPAKMIDLKMCLQNINTNTSMNYGAGSRNLVALLHEARHSLRMQSTGPTSALISNQAVFDYFDGIRKVITFLKRDILFVDPYLDAEFVSRYLPLIAAGVRIRLLTRMSLATLLPAVGLFVKQQGATVEVRSTAKLHDRFVFLDGSVCYQSGASFKDGAKKAPVTLTQITDALGAMLQTYEAIWAAAKVEKC